MLPGIQMHPVMFSKGKAQKMCIRDRLKTTYTPHVDCGDYVIIINAKDAVLTGKRCV